MVEVHGHIVTIKKASWPAEVVETAICNDMTFDGTTTITIDLRIVCREALLSFFNNQVKEFMTSSRWAEHRRIMFPKIKQAYKDLYDYFMNNYYPRLNYERQLYQHQKDVLSTSMYRRVNLFALEQGLGKTITSASISKIFQVPRTIIVCPAIVKWNWFRDMTDEWGYNKLYWSILDAKKSRTMIAFSERFCVVNYDILEKNFNHLVSMDCGHIIIDECQGIKNHSSLRAKNVRKLLNAFPKARVTLLSGTPVTNRVNDMFSYLQVAGHPLGKSYRNFISKYTISGTRGKVSGSQNIDDLKCSIANFMIRKRTIDCVGLPPLIINNYVFPMEEHRDDYIKVLGDLAQQTEEYDAESNEVERNKKRIAVKANLHTLNRLVATSKVKSIATLAESLIEMDKKVVIFSSYTNPLIELEKIFKDRCVRIDGSVDALDRDKYIQQFKNDPKKVVFLGNVKAAGVGINLVNANDVIFTNFPFTPDDLEQPYKRLHRIGQKSSVNVYYTICEDTIDEHIYNIIVSKTRDINNLIDNNADGVVNYEEIENKLFRELMLQYKKLNIKK